MKNTKKLKKKFGQNFLTCNKTSEEIVNILLLENRNVLEVGAGNLALTNLIIKKKPKNFFSLEIDTDITDKIKNNYLINYDALKFNEVNFFKKNNFIIISNLPFNISSQLLIKWLKLQYKTNLISGMILMFQKELGERIIAKKDNKKYGRLSILTQSIFNVTKEIIVKKEKFYPIPKVDAMVIKFTPIKKINNIKFEKLEEITNIFFNSRRKKNEKKIKKIFTKEQIIKNNFEKLYNLRPENISKEIFCKMSTLL